MLYEGAFSFIIFVTFIYVVITTRIPKHFVAQMASSRPTYFNNTWRWCSYNYCLSDNYREELKCIINYLPTSLLLYLHSYIHDFCCAIQFNFDILAVSKPKVLASLAINLHGDVKIIEIRINSINSIDRSIVSSPSTVYRYIPRLCFGGKDK